MKQSSVMQFATMTFSFIWILANGNFACQPEFKRISENVTLSCSLLSTTEPILWLFNNQSQINSSFSASVAVSKPHGGSLVILSHDMSVYGDYSCLFANGTLINCFSLHIQVTPTASVTFTSTTMQTTPTPTHAGQGSNDDTLIDAIVISFTIGVVVTIILTLAILAAQRKWRKHCKLPKRLIQAENTAEIAIYPRSKSESKESSGCGQHCKWPSR